MIALMSSNKSGVNVDGISGELHDAPVSDGRRRSWENRGRSQVVFNGPPPSYPTDDEERTVEKALPRCVDRQVSCDVAVQPA